MIVSGASASHVAHKHESGEWPSITAEIKISASVDVTNSCLQCLNHVFRYKNEVKHETSKKNL